MQPKVSVIVPVYKAEKYLNRSVDSILLQTFTDFEVLLIDDGSPDRSGKICDEYAAMDARVRVFHKENGGVSSARQCGIDNAQGEYTIHVDPDDFVEFNMLERLYNVACYEKADVVICNYIWDNGGKSKVINQRPNALDNHTVLNDFFKHLHGSVCNKLIRKDCCIKHGIRFPENINLYEDLIFNIELFKHPIKISYLNDAFYHYVQHINSHSLTRSYSQEVMNRDFKLRDYILNISKGYVDENIVLTSLNAMILQRSFFSGHFSPAEFKLHFFGLRNYIIKANQFSVLIRLAIYLSCIGLYGPIYKIMQILRKR